uniref:Reverse transcriptase domain-containing protein n=1 Tax=Amphimedon queenslandica TaxID=400682 RepID=A0A1X7VGL1_AMPQE
MWNARSIVNKLQSLHALLLSGDFHIIAITESWCSSFITDKEISPFGYFVYRHDRDTRGGGVFLAVSESVPSRVLDSLSSIELVVVDILTHPSIIICLAYVPPPPAFTYLKHLFSSINAIVGDKDFILLGDFNCPETIWVSLHGDNPAFHSLCEFVFDQNLCQLVTVPTHVKGNVLDLVLTQKPESIHDLCVHSDGFSPLPLSDHYPISFSHSCQISVSTHSHLPTLNYLKGDYVALNDYLLDIDWESYFLTEDVEQLLCFIKSVIYESCCRFVPLQTSHSKRYPKWFTGHVRHKLHKVRSLRIKVARSPGSSVAAILKIADQELQTAIIEAKSSFEADLVNKYAFSNDLKIFSHVQNLLGFQSIPCMMSLDSVSASTDAGIESLFNDFFHSVFSHPSAPPNVSSPPADADTVDNFSFSVSDVYKCLSSLDVHKCCGIDDIPACLLQSCAISLCEPIHHLFSQCVRLSYLPVEWRTHLVTPVYKSGDRSSVKNYRPILLLCILSKVLERHIFERIYPHIAATISHNQFGFKKQRSTLQQLLAHLNNIVSIVAQSKQVDVAYLDIKKAFDTVDHNLQLEKLWRCGICGEMWGLIKAYLSGRQQCVTVRGCQSGLLPVTSGVPQGSFLGPLFFILFINDLPGCTIHSNMLLFADDSKCSKSIASSSDCLLLQEDLDRVCEWSTSSGLKFNFQKTFLVKYRRKMAAPIVFNYCFGESIVPCNTSCKDLGIIFQEDLSWSAQVKAVLAKAYKTLSLLRRTFRAASTPTVVKKKLYLSLIIPIFTYCAPIWRPSLIKDIMDIEVRRWLL